jgi:hypothetical protein
MVQHVSNCTLFRSRTIFLGYIRYLLQIYFTHCSYCERSEQLIGHLGDKWPNKQIQIESA